MRIAATSDVHGNRAALEAVLADIETQGVDVVVNLGDLLSGALQPRETADRLLELDLPTVRGNHERQQINTQRERMGASDRHAHDSLADPHRAWLASLPLTLEVAPGALAFHGSPTDDLTYLLDTVTPEGAVRRCPRRSPTGWARAPTARCCSAGTRTWRARCGSTPAHWW